MKKAEKVQFVIDKLEELYPTTPIPLDHTDAYTLLVALLLSKRTMTSPPVPLLESIN